MTSTQSRPTLSPRQFQRLAFFGHGTNDLYWFILPILMPMMLGRYNLLYLGGGSVLSAYLLVVALCSFGVGRLSDRMDRWRIVGLGFLLTAAGFALASIHVPLPVFLGLLGVAAVGVSTFHPTMYGAIEVTVDAARGRFYGRFESWANLTVAVMVLITGPLLVSIPWNRVLLVVAIPGLVAGVTFLVARKPLVREKDLRAASLARAGVVAGATAGSAPLAKPRSTRALVLFLISNMLRFMTIMAVIGFTPTFFVHKVGVGADIAGYSTALFFVGGILGSRLGGRLADKHSPLAVMLVSLGFIGPLVFLFASLSSPVLLGGVLFALGLAAMGCNPPQNLALTRIGHTLGEGEVFGILIGAITVTQAFSPAVFGAVADVVGLANTMRIFSGPAVLSWILLFVMTRSPSAGWRDGPTPRC